MNRSNNHFFNNARWAEQKDQNVRKPRKPEIGKMIILAVAAIAGLSLVYSALEWVLK
jgi:hypothetical protein